jgi:hypothetical protein
VKKLMTIGWMRLCVAAAALPAQEPAWNAAAVRECDRPWLIGIMDGYMEAVFKHDPTAVPPLAKDVRMTENTGVVEVGEGVL